MREAFHVEISCGLGNQIFQYATARALALRHGARVVLEPEPGLFRRIPRAGRLFRLDKFKLAEGVEIRYPTPLLRLIGRGLNVGPRVPEVRETAFYQADPRILEARAPSRLVGYFQHPAYVAGLDQRSFAAELELAAPMSEEGTKVAERLRRNGADCALHLRLGDYVNHSLFHPLPPAYYRRALARIQALTGSTPRVAVFSNGTSAEVEPETGIKDPILVVNEPHREWEALHLMARCTHHVIANSSFSWWAAWLKGSSGVTVMPDRWLTPQTEPVLLHYDGWLVEEA